MPKPLIGLAGRRRKGSRIIGLPPVFADVDVDVYLARYAQAVVAADGIPVYLPLDSDPADLVPRLDGLLLTGGEDVAAFLHTQRPAAAATADTVVFDGQVPLRDSFELALVDAATQARLPVLGICRGAQLLTVAAGGTLHLDLPDHSLVDGLPDATPHTVTTVDGSDLRRLYGFQVAVNSLHHQAADRLGDGYIASAHSPDGIIEGIEHTELPIIAVQWHPELMAGWPSDPSFRWLTAQASSTLSRR